jgi:hypothetical protein
MARPQTENLNSADVTPMPWQPSGLPQGIAIRSLNEDPESGAVSGILEIPAGWQWTSSGYCAADQEFFVLEGELQIGDHLLQPGGFCFYPNGVLQPPWRAQSACELFAIFDARPAYVAAAESMPDADVSAAEPFVDSWAMDWFDPTSASDPSVAFRPGIFVKVLRHDVTTGTSTHLAGLMPGWFAEGIEVHPVHEESLNISGDVNIATVNNEEGYTCTVGSFYSRPAGVPHGPLASKNGNVGIVHTEGLLGIDYQTDATAMDRIMTHLKTFPWR